MRSAWRVAAAAGGILVLSGSAVAGCSARTDEAAPSAAPGGASLNAGPGGGAPGQVPLQEAGRQVISTATLRVEVGDVTAAASRAVQLATERGGFIADSEESGGADDRRARVTLKVPSERFDELVVAVAALGEVRSKQLDTQDVTDQVVDLEARLRAARAAADRLQQLIARSATVSEVVSVEGELAKRTAEIESLEGRLRVLRDQVDLATVTVALSRPQAAADDELPGFLAGLSGGWRALRATAIVGSAVVGALLPWLVPAALVGSAARTGWRAWRRRHPPRPRLPPPPWQQAGPPPRPPEPAAAAPLGPAAAAEGPPPQP